jgi:predicted RNase H-like HicB family nuclease
MSAWLTTVRGSAAFPVWKVWGNAATQEACEAELQEVLEEWIMLRLAEHLPIPPVDGIELTIRIVA